jgi:hypothetical protein
MGPACYQCRECGARGHLARDCSRTRVTTELHSEEEYGESRLVKEEDQMVDVKLEIKEEKAECSENICQRRL